MSTTPSGAPIPPQSGANANSANISPAELEVVELLLVEDNIDHLFLTRRELEKKLPCHVTTAQSAEIALQTIGEPANSSRKFDVVLVDNGLPGMSGLDMLTQLRSVGDNTPVILVAGQGSEAIAVEALRRGASDYVVKSGDYAELLPRVIAQVVERERMRRRNEHLESEHIRFARLAAVGEVATGIAHEIRNPLTVISGMASMIRDYAHRLSPEEINKCANTIAENCGHLNRVLEEVLQSAQPSQHFEELSLSELLDETLSFMRFDPAFRNRLQVERNFQTGGAVVGSRDQLKQVFINLFRNAAHSVQLAGEGRGVLRVVVKEASAESEDNARQVVVEVEDSGAGIPADVLPNIFESGFTTKRQNDEVDGSGLGLSISRRIIESHGGRIWAEAREPNQGALFRIALPPAPSTAE